MNTNNSVVIQIKSISLEVEKLSNKMLSPYNLTHSQFVTMKFLYQNSPATIRQIDIEKHFSLTNPTVTGIIQNLEKKGMIERVTNPEDSRSKVISITQKAKDLEVELTEFGEKIENQVTEDLSIEEKKQLLALLRKLRV